MGFYADRIYPWMVDRWGDPAPIAAIRARLIPQATGIVLEIGAGSGINFAYYDPLKVTKLFALEPNAGMRQLAERRRPSALKIEYLDLPGERIPLEDASVDTAVSTFTLCTIPAVQDAIHELRRVLRPGGQLVYFELGVSSDPGVRRWQERWEPLHRRAFAGLYLTRDIPALLAAGGFEVRQVESGYLAQFPKSWTHCFWGTAVPGSG
jgi:SAM-dependent methyltransferase